MSKRSKLFSLIIVLLFPLITFAQSVVINEIAWMGTSESANDEWIEIYNTDDNPVSLNGWSFFIGDKEIKLSGTISPTSFYILERTDENTLPEIKADLIYTGGIKNTGTKFSLLDDNKNIIDEIDFSNGFNFGNNETKQTMERIENDWQTSINNNGSPNDINIKNQEKEVVYSIIYLNQENNSFPYILVIIISIVFAVLISFFKLILVKK